MSGALPLPARTLSRRRKSKRLSVDESDRLDRLARVATRVREVLGSVEKAVHWLHEPNHVLGRRSPVSLLDTDSGARQGEAVIGRIDHGIPG